MRAQETDANIYLDITFHTFYSQHKPVFRITEGGRWNYTCFVVKTLTGQGDLSKLIGCQKLKFGYEYGCPDFNA